MKAAAKESLGKYFNKRIKPNWILYVFLIPAVTYAITFLYYPMYGLVIAFKQFNAGLGIIGSPWVGLRHFDRFFNSYIFWALIKNTLSISLYSFLAGIPIPIILALSFHYCYYRRFKKIVQTITYAPHFISMVVLVGMMFVFLSPRMGIINIFLKAAGIEPIYFMFSPDWYPHLYVWSGIWQTAGWSTIIYIATLAGVNTELYEAAIVDGASKLRRVWHIDIPVIMPTFMVLMILNLGQIMGVGFEKAFLMQNPGNALVSEIISTYTYKLGILNGEFSYTTAIGFFNNIINLVLLITANTISKRITKMGVM